MLPENMLHKAVEAESEDCKVDEISIKEDGFWRPLEPPVFQESCVIDEPGEFRIRLSNGYVAFYRYYIRTWDAEEGFGYIETEGPWDAIQEPYYWDEERWKLENRELLTTTNGIDAIILPLLCDVKNKKNPANYRIEVQVGDENPDHKFHLQVDSGSSVLWIQSRTKMAIKMPTTGCRVLNIPSFPKDVIHFIQGSGQYNLSYGTGPQLKINGMYRGLFKLGSLQVEQKFAAVAYQEVGPLMPTGMLGLGFLERNSRIPAHDNLVVQLHSAGLLKHASFTMIGPRSEPENTPAINTEGHKTRGWFVIGTLDQKYHLGVTWCQVDFLNARKWVVQLRRVEVNGRLICENQQALIDTGTSYLGTGRQNMDTIATFITGGITNVGTIEYASNALESVVFVFGDSEKDQQSFSLNEEDLSLGAGVVDPGKLQSPFVLLDNLEVTHPNGDYWVLGGIFLDNIITIFDYIGKKRIGFAAKSSIDPEV